MLPSNNLILLLLASDTIATCNIALAHMRLIRGSAETLLLLGETRLVLHVPSSP